MAEQIPLLFPQLIENKDSPFHTASAPTKQLFMSLKINTNKIPLELPFEPVEILPLVCTAGIAKNEKYYSCSECCYDTEIVEMVFCSRCYDPEKHKGHSVIQKISPIDDASCDCGRGLRINQKSFCNAHCAREIKVQIPEEKQQNFNKYMGELFEIYLYLRNIDEDIVGKLEEALDEKISQLCKNSIYYIRIVGKFLETPYKSNEQPSTYLLELLESFRFANLISALSADKEFLMKFAFIFMKEDEKGMKNLFPFKYARDQMLDSREILLALANADIFAEDKLANYLKVVEEGNEGYEMMVRFYDKIQEKQDPKEFLMLLTKDFKGFGNTNSHITSPFLLNLFIKNMNSKIELTEADKEWFPDTFSFVCNLLISLCEGKIEKVCNLSKYLEAKNCKVTEDEIDSFIEKLFDFDEMWTNFEAKMRIPILVTLILSRTNKKRDELINKVWKKILGKEDFLENIERLYNFIALLANSYRQFPILALGDDFSGKSELELKEQIFKSYLYESKEVSKDKLWKQYNEGWLKFKSVPQIIRSLCRYKEQNDVFIYDCPKEKYDNKILKIQQSLTRNWENLRALQISVDKDFEVKSSVLKNIFLTLFEPQGFYDIFSQKFLNALGKVQLDANATDKWKNKSLGEVYIILFVLFDKLCGGNQSVKMKKQIEQLSNDPDYRFKFQMFGERKKIFQILNISENFLNEEDNIIEEKEEKQKREKEQMRRKVQEKKSKMMEKYSKKREATFQKYASKQSQQIQDQMEQIQCLLCHERQKKDKKMVFMASLTMKDTVARVLHGEEVKTSTIVDTCFHPIHIPCFMSMKKKNMGFQCPLCTKNINCFLPINPENTQRKVWNITWNIFNALMVCQFEMCEVQSLFSLLFEAFVENKGISRLIIEGLPNYENKRRDKVDNYFDSLIVNIFENTSNQAKEEFQQQYKNLMIKIQTCKRPQFELIQKLIVKSCWLSLKEGVVEIDEPSLEKLFSKMIESEAQILIKVLKEICGETNEYDFQAIYEKSVKNKQSEENIMTEDDQKYVFGFNILRPKKTIEQMLKTQENKKCVCESDKISSQCMLCQKFFCKQCEDDDNHKQTHCGKMISFFYLDGVVRICKGPRENQTVDIYFNDFMINYKKGKQYTDNPTTYWLNQLALEKAIGNFLGIKN